MNSIILPSLSTLGNITPNQETSHYPNRTLETFDHSILPSTTSISTSPPTSFWSFFRKLVAGGIAGAVSRTVISPLERMKILFQLQGPGTAHYDGVTGTLKMIWKDEGILGFLRGNGANVVRIVPYSAVQFAAYEQLKSMLTESGDKDLGTLRRLTAGAGAGICSVTCTYPLDIVRTRLAVQSATNLNPPSNIEGTPVIGKLERLKEGKVRKIAPGKLPGILQTMKVLYRTEGGIQALYRGLGVTLTGIAPYVALNFYSYETLRAHFTPPGQTSPSVGTKLVCGAMAGSLAQTATYPLDVLRRRMQVNTMQDVGFRYRNTWHALVTTVKQEGPSGLYKGLLPNYLKVAPAISVSFVTYEWCMEHLPKYG